MTLKRVDPNGTIEINFPSLSGITVVGAGNTLADASDATYVEGDPDGLNYDVEMDALASYDDGDPITLHVRLSLESEDHTGTEADLFFFLQDNHPTNISGTYYVGQFTSSSYNTAAAFPPPFDGTPKELVLPLAVRPGHTLAECVAVLESGTAYVAVNSLHIVDAGPLHARVYEMWIEVGETVLSPCYETLTATTWDQWADGDDGTSVALGVAGATYSELTPYDGRSILDITANFRASSTETTESTINSIEVGDAWDGSAFRNLASSSYVSIPNDGVVRDYSVTLTFTEDAATIRDALDIAGNAVLMFNTSSARDVFIHEASLRVGHKCVVPLNRLRQWPGGATSIRQYPRRGTRRPGTY
jgi:hypothetical protein